MKTKEQYIHLLSDFQKKRGSVYGIIHLGIFGSVARGEQTDESDVERVVTSFGLRATSIPDNTKADVEFIQKHAKLIVDMRNMVKDASDNVYKL